MAEVGSLDLETLVVEHHAVLYRYAYRLCGHATDAEDLTQQTYLKAQSKLTQLRDLASARGWLFSILKNEYLQSRRRRTPLPVDLEADLANVSTDAVPEGPIDRELLDQVLGELPEPYRLVVVMFYFDDCSYEQMARQLGVPLGTIMSRLSRARLQLRQRLAERHLAERDLVESAQTPLNGTR